MNLLPTALSALSSALPTLIAAPLVRSGDPGPFIAILMLGLFGCCFVPLLVVWIWMIIDCAQNEKSEGNERLIWILVIVLAGWIGALIYFFARRPQRRRELGR